MGTEEKREEMKRVLVDKQREFYFGLCHRSRVASQQLTALIETSKLL